MIVFIRESRKIRLFLRGKMGYNVEQYEQAEEISMINNNEMFLLKLGEVVLKGLNRHARAPST